MTDQENLKVNQNDEDREWDHKWGFADTQFLVNDDGSVTLTGHRYPLCGQKLPYLLPYLEVSVGVKIDWQQPRQENQNKQVPPPRREEAFLAAIEKHFPSHCFSDNERDRLCHSHGQTMIDEVNQVIYNNLERTVDLVFYCQSETDAQTLVQLAVKHNVCLVPYGGGTSVSAALTLPQDESRMIVAVDMRPMNQIEWIDPENRRACIQAGITGRQLDSLLRKKGFMSGHEPDSREFSTLGGWIATNASGMKKNRYGNIEDIVESINLITPAGILTQQSPNPRVSMGMSLQELCFGSEGNLGLITKAVIRIQPVPETQKYASLIFPNFHKGVAFLHELSQTNFVPASVRLVDNDQFQFGQALKPKKTGWKAWLDRFQKLYLFKILQFSPQELAATTIVMEGSQEEVTYQAKSLSALAKKHGGINGGSSNGRGGYMLTYTIAYIGQFVLGFHLFGETFETTVPWSKIHAVREAVKTELKKHHEQLNLPGKPYVCSRVTQVYPTGVCMYFTIVLYMKGVNNAEHIFSDIYASLRQIVIDCGGSISHHHGVGKIRKQFMSYFVSPASIELMRKLKQASDPLNIFGIRNNIF